MSDLHVPGYDVGDLLGFGATGEVWAARDRVSHAAVALKRLRAPDAEARDRLLHEATVLSRVTHPHVVRLLDVRAVGDAVVLVLEHAAGGSLRQLLAARERLSPGEVVTLLVPLAEALAEVHAQGAVHGDVTPGNVLLSADGRPLLADLGVARLLGVAARDVDGTEGYVDPAVVAGAPPGPAADVHGLAATCWAALTGAAPYDALGRRLAHPWLGDGAAAPLVALLDAAMAPDPAARPDPGALAAAAYQAADAAPLRRPGLPLDVPVTPGGEAATYRVRSAAGADEPPPARSGHRRSRPADPSGSRWRRGVLAALVLAGLVSGGLTVVGARTRGEPSPVAARPSGDRAAAISLADDPRPAARAPARSPDRFAAVLRDLDARRSVAFARADPDALEAVYAPGSPALRRDRARLAALVTRGQRAEGVRLRPTRVDVRRRDGDRVVLAVVDVLKPYRLRALDSGQVTSAPGRGARTWQVTLQRGVDRWEVYDVADP